MTYKKVWSYQELAEKMTGRIKLPKSLYAYDFMRYPHWSLVTALHFMIPISEYDLDRNLKVIEELGMEEIYNIKMEDLRDRGIYA